MSSLFIRLKWSADPVQVSVISSNFETGQIQYQKLTVGEERYFRIVGGKFCIGSEVDRGKWISCIQNRISKGLEPVNEKLETGLQCSICQTSDFFACRMTCTGAFCRPSSERAFQLCQPPETMVYLTTIGDKNKVGVSLNGKKRWLEQGSDYATWVVKLPGLEARAVEHRVARELGLALQVSSKYKQGIIHRNSQQNKMDELSKAIPAVVDITQQIMREQNVPAVFNEEVKILDLTPYYGQLDSIDKPVQEIEITENSEFGGKIVAIKGAFVIFEKEGYYYSLNCKKIEGYVFEEISNASIETQFSLDDWF